MGTITTTDGTEIFYKDWGSGQPIVFSHGWPLSGDDWDTQMLFFLQHGYRVIAHDRRGHGRSTQTSDALPDRGRPVLKITCLAPEGRQTARSLIKPDAPDHGRGSAGRLAGCTRAGAAVQVDRSCAIRAPSPLGPPDLRQQRYWAV
jgi:pimeloyl-ACP methyl ester carboxylesterase